MKPQVMILGTFHFFEPYAEEQLKIKSPARQGQIEDVVARISAFKPTKIAIELEPRYQSLVDKRLPQYLNGGTLYAQPPERLNERNELGFRMAKACGISKLYAIDYMNIWWLGFAHRWAKKKQPRLFAELTNLLNEGRQWGGDLTDKTIAEILAVMNGEEVIRLLHAPYMISNQIGAYKNYIGTACVTTWYKRNLRIFANLQGICETGDRILVIYGAGHLAILNGLVRDYSQMEFVSPLPYL